MILQSIETSLYYIPLAHELTDSSHGVMRDFAVVMVKLKTACGAEGLGYTYTVGRTGGTGVRSLIDEDLSPILQGADPRRIESLWHKMWWRLHYSGRGGLATFAISAVDIALWDLKARLAGEPLWRLLGGADPQVKAYAGGIDLQLPLDDLRRQTEANIARGFRAIKMKVGRQRLSEDVDRIGALRSWVGNGIPIMVDANMRWSVRQAIEASRAFAPLGVYWLEEPTIPDDVDGPRRIEAEGPVPVATGENYHTIYEFQKIIAAQGVSFPEPDVSNIGGITNWIKVAHLAEAHNLPVTSHGVHDLHVHLLAAVPNASFLEVHGFALEDYLLHPMQIVDGFATAPDRPGHGVEFDWDKINQHKVS
jgi:L-alanine-DL-glutamate epimerase-like enolase superfamily enzyme